MISAIFTGLVHSSGVTTSLIVGLSTQGLISLNMAVPLVFGANIGTCFTAAVATIGTTSREAKRVAIAHFTFKFIAVSAFAFFIGPFTHFVEYFSVQTTAATWQSVHNVAYIPRQIANAHTFFNLVMALSFIPFTRQIEKLIYLILPDAKRPDEEEFRVNLDPFLLDTPNLALQQAKEEVLRMGRFVQDMIDRIMEAFLRRDLEYIDNAIDMDEKVDMLEEGLKSYFTELAQRKSSSSSSALRIEMFFIVDELERIGDVISKNILPQVNQLVENNLYFSEQGWKELSAFHSLVSENFGRSMDIFKKNDLTAAKELVQEKQQMLRLYKKLQTAHLERLCPDNKDTVSTSQIHLDILGNMRGINSSITNIADSIVEHGGKIGPEFNDDFALNAAASKHSRLDEDEDFD
jgi:phosphate:Na+ symporter